MANLSPKSQVFVWLKKKDSQLFETCNHFLKYTPTTRDVSPFLQFVDIKEPNTGYIMKKQAIGFAVKSVIVAAALSMPPHTAAQDLAPTQINWSERATNDIRAAHKLMLDNHPGSVNEADQTFLAMAENALTGSLELAKQADSAPKWKYSLKSYAAQFRDGHFSIEAEDEESSPRPLWPGFVVAWRNDKVVIHHSDDPTNFPVGAEIVSCDGRAIKECIHDHVFGFQGNPEIEGSWTVVTPLLMFDDGNPFVEAPKQVELRLAESKTAQKLLTWKEISSDVDWYERWNRAMDGPKYPTSIEHLPNDIWWIRLPDFQPNETEQARFDNVVETIKKNLDSIRACNAIVFDLRRNNGGNSRFPLQISELIWGEEYSSWRESQTGNKTTFVEWRASQANIEMLTSYIPILKKQGWTEGQLKDFDQLIEGMSNAAAAGNDLYRQPEEAADSETQNAPTRTANPVKASIFVVVTGRSASASLDAVDIINKFENVALVGSTTSSDSNYMDICRHPLPSGKATLYCPMKVYRNRSRESGFVYQPDFKYEHLDWSDATFKPWLESVIDKQLNDK